MEKIINGVNIESLVEKCKEYATKKNKKGENKMLPIKAKNAFIKEVKKEKLDYYTIAFCLGTQKKDYERYGLYAVHIPIEIFNNIHVFSALFSENKRDNNNIELVIKNRSIYKELLNYFEYISIDFDILNKLNSNLGVAFELYAQQYFNCTLNEEQNTLIDCILENGKKSQLKFTGYHSSCNTSIQYFIDDNNKIIKNSFNTYDSRIDR